MAWSQQARQAAIEARKRKAKGKGSSDYNSSGEKFSPEMKAHNDNVVRLHAQRKVRFRQIAQKLQKVGWDGLTKEEQLFRQDFGKYMGKN